MESASTESTKQESNKSNLYDYDEARVLTDDEIEELFIIKNFSKRDEIINRLSTMPTVQRRKAVAAFGSNANWILKDKKAYEYWLRKDQIFDKITERYICVIAGRGWGKSIAGCYWLAQRILKSPPGTTIGIISKESTSTRRNILDAENGLWQMIDYDRLSKDPNMSTHQNEGSYKFPNGVKVYMFTSEAPENIRGVSLDYAYCDEIAHWWRPDAAWENIKLAMRSQSGLKKQVLITSTPTNSSFVKRLINPLENPSMHLISGNSFANYHIWKNDESWKNDLVRRVNTRIGRQEILGQITSDTGYMFDPSRFKTAEYGSNKNMEMYVIGVDPAMTSTNTSATTGIIVVGKQGDMFYLMEDRSGKYTSNQWANEVKRLISKYDCRKIICETNQGGDLVVDNLKASGISTNLIHSVYASKGKWIRAEPIANLFEQDRIRFFHHSKDATHWDALKEELSEMQIGVKPDKSPDRLDAMVWAISWYIQKAPQGIRLLNEQIIFGY